jgi:hypothetical protein
LALVVQAIEFRMVVVVQQLLWVYLQRLWAVLVVRVLLTAHKLQTVTLVLVVLAAMVVLLVA